MRQAKTLAGRSLEWAPTNWMHVAFDLRDGDDVAATLSYRHMMSSIATAESADGCWSFRRIGVLQTRSVVRACEQERELAVYRSHVWKTGGIIEIPDGRRFRVSSNMWTTKFEITGHGGSLFVRHRVIGGPLRHSAVADILPVAAPVLAEMPWLLMFGWYVVLQAREDAMAGSAAGCG